MWEHRPSYSLHWFFILLPVNRLNYTFLEFKGIKIPLIYNIYAWVSAYCPVQKQSIIKLKVDMRLMSMETCKII